MKEQLSDVQRLVWGCPVCILMQLLWLTLGNRTLSLAKGDMQIPAQPTQAVFATARELTAPAFSPWLQARCRRGTCIVTPAPLCGWSALLCGTLRCAACVFHHSACSRSLPSVQKVPGASDSFPCLSHSTDLRSSPGHVASLHWLYTQAHSPPQTAFLCSSTCQSSFKNRSQLLILFVRLPPTEPPLRYLTPLCPIPVQATPLPLSRSSLCKRRGTRVPVDWKCYFYLVDQGSKMELF